MSQPAKYSKPGMRAKSRRPIRTRHQHNAQTKAMQMTRKQAVNEIMQLLNVDLASPQALALVDLFHIQAEELSEAGLTYERLKSLERRCLHFI